LPDGSSEPVESTQYKTFKLAEAAFGAGVNGPIVVVATSDSALAGQAKTDFQANVASEIMKNSDVRSVLPAAVSKDATKYLFQVIPKDGPASASTEQLVFDIRGLSDRIHQKYGATVGVTGLTAANIDLAKKLGDALPGYLATILILSLLLLILVFRSILIPLIASAGFMLTVFATLGATVAVFQWGWLGWVFGIHDPGPVMSFVPTIIIGVVFGLAMDYQLFLGSGMREAYVHGKSPRESINFGIHLSRAVVIAAAIIMIGVFGGFAFSDSTSIRPIGFGLAAGVLFDAFLVRLLLVPALMRVFGKAAWWMPKWLDRLLPEVDVEGAALERDHLH
jgi:RND superfamily putative drug exporter